jgi:hypothetical protein
MTICKLNFLLWHSSMSNAQMLEVSFGWASLYIIICYDGASDIDSILQSCVVLNTSVKGGVGDTLELKR